MDEAARTLLGKALALDDRDRAHLATELLRSLDEPDSDSQEEVDRLWKIEIERRSNQVRTGSSRSVPWDEVRSRVERTLASRLTPMDDPGPRHIDVDSMVAGMGQPTDDDVPMTLDWEPLNTKDKLLAYLADINESRERDQSDSGCSVAPPVAPHGEPDQT